MSSPLTQSVSHRDTGGLHITVEKGQISPKNHEVEHREHYNAGSPGVAPGETGGGEQTVLREAELAWCRVRRYMQDPFSEFCGTFILVLFGDGSVAQVVLSSGTKGDYQSISWGWG